MSNYVKDLEIYSSNIVKMYINFNNNNITFVVFIDRLEQIPFL